VQDDGVEAHQPVLNLPRGDRPTVAAVRLVDGPIERVVLHVIEGRAVVQTVGPV
jgi:hypothetical protein